MSQSTIPSRPFVHTRRAMIAMAGAALLAACATPQTRSAPKSRAAARGAEAAETRMIGFDLWAGVPGAAFGDRIDVTVGSRTIRGPFRWRHPKTGETMTVYERINRERKGDKRQLYTLTNQGQTLGRVFDSRPGRADRYFTGDAFFPLGEWKVGERRLFTMTEHEGARAEAYAARLRMRRLSYSYRDIDDSLKFDWRLRDFDGATIYDERYIYSPGKGFTRFFNRAKKA